MSALRDKVRELWNSAPSDRRLDEGPAPWGCILEEHGTPGYGIYCDDCPVREICPHDKKRYSK